MVELAQPLSRFCAFPERSLYIISAPCRSSVFGLRCFLLFYCSRVFISDAIVVRVLLFYGPCRADSASIGGDGLLPGGMAVTHRRAGQHASHVSLAQKLFRAMIAHAIFAYFLSIQPNEVQNGFGPNLGFVL